MKRHFFIIALLSFAASACDNQPCEVVPVNICGNNIINDGEECDGHIFGAKTCADYKGEGASGTLKCTEHCKIDASQCAAIVPQLCGNGVIDPGEECDSELFGAKSCKDYKGEKASGALKCTDECRIDDAQCSAPEPELCGNDVIDAGEECDGESFGAKTCKDYKGSDATGNLTCTDECEIDDSQCIATEHQTCGNNVIDAGEECDTDNFGAKTCKDFKGENATGMLKCTDECKIDDAQCAAPLPELCGNEVIDDGEECDGSIFGAKSCEDYQGKDATGNLACTDACKIDASACKHAIPETCNNDKLDDGEVCDGTHLNGMNCAKVGFGYTGIVKCLDDCSDFDTSACKAPDIHNNCGNNKLDDDEYCDGDIIRGDIWYSCKAYFGPGSTGTISCKKDCSGLVMDCTTPYTCGNGSQQINEKCDPQKDYGDKMFCENVYGETFKGNRSCNSLCRWDNSKCVPPDHCGNGIVEPELGETCDPGAAQSFEKTCEDAFGEGSWGNVTCNSFCRISYAGCFPAKTCGNGILENGVNDTPNYNEVCDSQNLNNKKCSHLGSGYSGTLKCLNNCSGFDFSECEYTEPTE